MKAKLALAVVALITGLGGTAVVHLDAATPPTSLVVWRTGRDFLGHSYGLAPVTEVNAAVVTKLWTTVHQLPATHYSWCPAAQSLVRYNIAFRRGASIIKEYRVAPDGCQLLINTQNRAQQFQTNTQFWNQVSAILHVSNIHHLPR